MSIEAFPVGELVAKELEARGWTTAYAATLISGNPAENELWLDLLCCNELWERNDISFSEPEAEQLAELFGTSAKLWLNLHESYLRAKTAIAEGAD